MHCATAIFEPLALAVSSPHPADLGSQGGSMSQPRRLRGAGVKPLYLNSEVDAAMKSIVNMPVGGGTQRNSKIGTL